MLRRTTIIDPDLTEEIIDRNISAMLRIPNELFNQGLLDSAEQFVTTDYVDHANVPPGWPVGIDGLRQTVSMMRSAFPDLHAEVADIVAEEDRVVLRTIFTGTQEGDIIGIAPTGKQVCWQAMHICRVENGKLTDHWEVSDMLGLMQQLGATS